MLSSARDALARNAPGADEPGEGARFLVTRAGAVPVRELDDGAHLQVEEQDPRRGAVIPAVLLGEFDGAPLYAVEMAEPSAEIDDPGRPLRDLRQVAERLPVAQRDVALAAVAMGAWHRSTRHCPLCGSDLLGAMGGWVLRCPHDGSEQFPRTDPAVIMAVRDDQDRLLLAHGARFRPGFFSVLAGFVEPGESAEAAVAREAHEETGVVISEVEYVGSQPWPFPRTLMLGYRAWASGQQVLDLQPEEILEARWVERGELAELVHSGQMELPGSASMGHALIRDWYGQELPHN